MWAQLINLRLKPGKDPAVAAEQLRAAEQPRSGLIREMSLRTNGRSQRPPSTRRSITSLLRVATEQGGRQA